MLTATDQIPTQMKAIVYSTHGSPDVLKLTDRAIPVPKQRQVLVKVRAASLNPLDWHMMRGEPSFLKMVRPAAKEPTPGVEFAGRVEKVGPMVTEFRPGDEVFGNAWGSLAQYVCVKTTAVLPKPQHLTFEQAATIPCAGCTALQSLRDYGRLQPGERVLINGAAGGVGSYAVQIAKALGAEVTGVCSTRNVEFLRSIGADHVIDYTAEEFPRNGRFDLVVQVAGTRTNPELRRALTPRGRLVLVGGGTGREEDDNISIVEVLGSFAGNILAPWMRQPTRMMMAKTRRRDLLFLTELIEAGRLTPVIDRTYPLSRAAEAMRYLESGRVRGKVAVTPETV